MAKSRSLVWLLSCLLAMPVQGDSDKVLGVSPWTSGQLLQAWMQPVLKHLERETGYNYQFKSAPSLNDYLVRVVEDEFDLIMIPMHMGLFLKEQFRFKPLMFVRSDVNVMLVTHMDSMYKNLADLNGADIHMADPISIAGFFTEGFLEKNNIVFNKRYFGHHWKLTDGLIKREIAVAPIVNNHIKQKNGKTSDQLNILHLFPEKLDGIMLLPPQAPTSEMKKLQAVLSVFRPSDHSMITKIEPVSKIELQEWHKMMSKYFPKMKSRIKSLHPDFSKKVGWK